MIIPIAWWARNRCIVVMNTTAFDGQWTRKVIEWLGFGTAQGSSSRGGLRGLAVMAKRLSEGLDCAFTIDGPRGPRYIAKPGPVILARKTGCPIVVFHIGVDRGKTFEKTWDHFLMPAPFARTVLLFWYDTFELCVFQRMVFGHDGQALVGGIERRTFR